MSHLFQENLFYKNWATVLKYNLENFTLGISILLILSWIKKHHIFEILKVLMSLININHPWDLSVALESNDALRNVNAWHFHQYLKSK